MSDSSHRNSTRKAILAELQSLTSMARGSLAEEFREQPAPGGSGTKRLGPYFKHQFWENGRNHSARVPAACVERLREDLQNGKRFEQLTAQLAALAIEEGAARRAALVAKPATDAGAADAKKNTRKSASRNATRKQKPISKPSSRGSQPKA
jgi:mannitol-1-phosphate/altronate dehydrogenase